jgi:two-component system LytT family response regulator
MNLRTLIVDDEPVARQRIRRFLNDESGIAIIGECGDGRSAVEAILTQDIDLVFLDLQMPELDGFQVISSVGIEQMPVVVFVTAHDEFALKAFDAQAVDYILKPVSQDRFRVALERAKSIAARKADWTPQVAGVLSRLPASRPAAPLAIRANGRIVLLQPAEIEWVESEGDYLRIHVGTESHLIRARMHEVHDRLGIDRFFRIHRSTLVNLDAIREFRPVHSGESILILKNGRRLSASRTCSRQFQQKLGAIG